MKIEIVRVHELKSKQIPKRIEILQPQQQNLQADNCKLSVCKNLYHIQDIGAFLLLRLSSTFFDNERSLGPSLLPQL